MFYIQQ